MTESLRLLATSVVAAMVTVHAAAGQQTPAVVESLVLDTITSTRTDGRFSGLVGVGALAGGQAIQVLGIVQVRQKPTVPLAGVPDDIPEITLRVNGMPAKRGVSSDFDELLLWAPGVTHFIVGMVQDFGASGYAFDGDANYPLHFKVIPDVG